MLKIWVFSLLRAKHAKYLPLPLTYFMITRQSSLEWMQISSTSNSRASSPNTATISPACDRLGIVQEVKRNRYRLLNRQRERCRGSENFNRRSMWRVVLAAFVGAAQTVPLRNLFSPVGLPHILVLKLCTLPTIDVITSAVHGLGDCGLHAVNNFEMSPYSATFIGPGSLPLFNNMQGAMNPYNLGYVHIHFPLLVEHSMRNMKALPVPFELAEFQSILVGNFGMKFSCYSKSCRKLILKTT